MKTDAKMGRAIGESAGATMAELEAGHPDRVLRPIKDLLGRHGPTDKDRVHCGILAARRM